MEFKFKRKYTFFFFLAIALHTIVLLFWIFFPKDAFPTQKGKQITTILALINCELILIFYLGLFRKKYFAYFDKIIIKRSFVKNLTINYINVIKIKERNHDSILLGIGTRPSFVIYYKNRKNKPKRTTIRTDNNPLLLKVIKNEIDISKLHNTNMKKLTK